MYRKTSSNIKEEIIKALQQAQPTLEQLKDKYFIIGATALILSGIEVGETADIDILTSHRDADFLRNVWKDFALPVPVQKEEDEFISNFSRYDFGKLIVEVMGDLKVRKAGVWLPLTINFGETIDLGEFKVSVPTLAEQKRVLSFFGRAKDLARIKIIEAQLKK